MKAYLLATYEVDYRGGIYDLLQRLDLSHQKAHADYGNADPAQQQVYLDDLKQTLLTAGPNHAVIMYTDCPDARKWPGKRLNIGLSGLKAVLFLPMLLLKPS